MATTIKTKADIDRLLKVKAQEILDDMADKVKEQWRTLIQTKFYNLYDPVSYHRTYQLLDSIQKSEIRPSGNGYTIEIFMDESQITNRRGNHYSLPVSTVFDLVVQGFHGAVQTEYNFYEEVQNWLQSGQAKKDFAAILKKNGIKAHVN